MSIYTKTGDDGTTGLLGPGRVGKDHLRIEAYGTIDELNAALGLARASDMDPETDAVLARLQEELFAAGASLADPNPDGPFHEAPNLDHIGHLEREIDAMDQHLAPLTRFILPGGIPAAAHLHLARTICRRAERLLVRLGHEPGQYVAPALLPYINRLSDHLFTLARAANLRAGHHDVPWQGL